MKQYNRSRGFFKSNVKRLLVVLLLVGAPPLGYWAYWAYTRFPTEIVFALGQEGGLHRGIGKSLMKRLESDPNLKYGGLRKIAPCGTRGSLDVFRGLQFGEFQFAVYQAGTAALLSKREFDALDAAGGDGPGNADGRLSFKELQWRRPENEGEATQRSKTESAFRALGKDPLDDSQSITLDEFADESSIRFVANLYSEVVHVVVRADTDLFSLGDLFNGESSKRHRVAVGDSFSGGLAMSLFLLGEFGPTGLKETPGEWPFEVFSPRRRPVTAAKEWDAGYYKAVEDAFATGELDAAIITMGVGEDTTVARLLGTGEYRLLPIPLGESLRRKHLLISEYTIPAGIYRSVAPTSETGWLLRLLRRNRLVVPPRDVRTIAVKAKLLARADVDSRLVAGVADHILREDFQFENRLEELFSRSRAERLTFVQETPEFVIHPGAHAVYNPDQFDLWAVEKMEALYSLIASCGIAAFLSARWIYRRRERKRGHRLDQLIKTLLEIERRQLPLDTGPNLQHEKQLQDLLDEITTLRMHTLAQFSAYELKEDPAGQYFVELCHSLSDKINAKLSRQRMDTSFEALIDAIKTIEVSGTAKTEPHSQPDCTRGDGLVPTE